MTDSYIKLESENIYRVKISSLYLLPLKNGDVLRRAHCVIMRFLNVFRSISVIWLVNVLEIFVAVPSHTYLRRIKISSLYVLPVKMAMS